MNILSVWLKDLRLLLRDRGEMASLFLMPLAFILPICLAFPTNGYNLTEDRKPELPVANFDVVDGMPGEHAQALLDSLAESYTLEQNITPANLALFGADVQAICATRGPVCDEVVARTLVEYDNRAAAAVIPAGFSAAIDAGQPVSVTLLYNPSRTPVDRQLVEGVLTGSTMRLSIENQLFNGLEQFGDLLDLAPEEIRTNIRTSNTEEGAQAAAELAPAVAVVSVQPSTARITTQPNTLQQTIPGYTVMFVYFLIGTVVASVQLERNTGVLRRLLVTPMHKSALLAGKILSALVIGVLQVAVMFAVGAIIFGLDLGSAPVALVVLTVAVVLSAVCIGLAAAAYRLERGISIMLIVGALIAGCAFPADWLPPLLQTVNVVLPQTWAMQGYQDLITRGQGFGAVLPEIGVLLGFAAVFFAIAVRKFDLEG
jgi:ABC-2 type transport system permease protein